VLVDTPFENRVLLVGEPFERGREPRRPRSEDEAVAEAGRRRVDGDGLERPPRAGMRGIRGRPAEHGFRLEAVDEARDVPGADGGMRVRSDEAGAVTRAVAIHPTRAEELLGVAGTEGDVGDECPHVLERGGDRDLDRDADAVIESERPRAALS